MTSDVAKDIMSPAKRSALMGRIRGKNTKPELFVRRLLHRLGYRFRTHSKELPGRPDIVFSARRRVVFVHGCFWHRHDCDRAYVPKTRSEFWQRKFRRNVERDREDQDRLQSLGWQVLVIWECEINPDGDLEKRLTDFLGPCRYSESSRRP